MWEQTGGLVGWRAQEGLMDLPDRFGLQELKVGVIEAPDETQKH